MAKTTVSKTKQPRIPESLRKHLREQQDRMLLVASNLDVITWALETEEGTRTETASVALRHLSSLLCDIHEALDVVRIEGAAEVTS